MRAGSPRVTGAVTVDLDQVVLAVAGDLDAGTHGTIRPILDAAVAAVGEDGTLLLDLGLLDNLDDTGVSVLADLAGRVRRAGAQLGVQGVRAHVFAQLEAGQLLETLDVDQPTGSPDLVRDLAGMTTSVATQSLLDASLKLVVTMAQSVIGQADGVSVTLPRHGRYRTVAASNDVVLAMDHDQYDTGQGPCLDAAREGQRFHIDSLEGESRWADFVPRAQARGIASILSSPLLDGERPLGALNIYSRTESAFHSHEKQWAHQFATEASGVLAAAHQLTPSTELLAQVVQALGARQVIALAQGIVMQRDDIGPDAAYASLRETSRATSRPLHDVCAALAENQGRQAAP